MLCPICYRVQWVTWEPVPLVIQEEFTSFRKSGKLFTAGIDRNCFRVEMFGTLWTLPKSSLDCVKKADTDTM